MRRKATGLKVVAALYAALLLGAWAVDLSHPHPHTSTTETSYL